ncbi:MAG: hypothetical protein ABIA66_01180 [Candidatus Omnitrophota bacterium]
MIRCMMYNEGQMKLPVYDASSLANGQLLIWGTDAAAQSKAFLIDAAATSQDAFAVLCQSVSTAASALATPIIYQARVELVENLKVWKIYYDMAGADLDVSSYTSPTITTGTIDDKMDGGWIYVNSGPGQGELRYVSGADTSTLTVSTAFTTTLTSVTDFILIRHVGRPEAGLALDATFTMLAANQGNLTTSEGMVVLKNFIQGGSTGIKELDPTLNSELTGADNLHNRGVRFFSHVIFADNDSTGRGI